MASLRQLDNHAHLVCRLFLHIHIITIIFSQLAFRLEIVSQVGHCMSPEYSSYALSVS